VHSVLFERRCDWAADGYFRMKQEVALHLAAFRAGAGDGVAICHNAGRASGVVNIARRYATMHLEYDSPFGGWWA